MESCIPLVVGEYMVSGLQGLISLGLPYESYGQAGLFWTDITTYDLLTIL